MHMKKKIAAACVAAMAAFSLPMGIVPVQPVQADLITDVIGGFQVKSALSKQIKHYDTTKEGQSEIYQSVTKQTGVLNNSYYDERLASIMNRLSASIAQTDPASRPCPTAGMSARTRRSMRPAPWATSWSSIRACSTWSATMMKSPSS